jgi:hypothetical protein
MRRAFVHLIIAGAIASVGTAQSISPSPPSTNHRFHAVFASPAVFPYQGADAVVVRRALGEPHEIVLLRRDRMTPELLSEAAFTLQAIHARHGGPANADLLVRVHRPTTPRSHAGQARKWLAFLNSRTPHELSGFGEALQMGVWLRSDEVHVKNAP